MNKTDEYATERAAFAAGATIQGITADETDKFPRVTDYEWNEQQAARIDSAPVAGNAPAWLQNAMRKAA